MNALERAVAVELRKHMPDGYLVEVRAGAGDSVVIQIRDRSAVVPRSSLIDLDAVLSGREILSVWCQRVAKVLIRRVAS